MSNVTPIAFPRRHFGAERVAHLTAVQAHKQYDASLGADLADAQQQQKRVHVAYANGTEFGRQAGWRDGFKTGMVAGAAVACVAVPLFIGLIVATFGQLLSRHTHLFG